VAQQREQALQEVVVERLGHRNGRRDRIGQDPRLVVTVSALMLPRQAQ